MPDLYKSSQPGLCKNLQAPSGPPTLGPTQGGAMAWLVEAAREAGYPSVRALSAAVRDFDGAPPFDSVNQHLLLVNRLDEQGVAWLLKRPEVLASLARRLGWTEESLRGRLTGRGDDPDAVLLDLADLRSERAWDLRADPLFPGVPAQVRQPAAWRRLWWHAEAGAGRSLVGRWLVVREDVQYVRERTWPRARSRIQPGRPAYVELLEAVDAEALLRGDGLEGRQLCVVAPFAPPPRKDRAGKEIEGPWEVVRSPPADQWVGAMFDWLAPFYDGGGGYTRERAERVWKRLASPTVFRTPSAVMAFAGLVEAVGEPLAVLPYGEAYDRMLRAWVQQLAERGDRPADARAWFRREGLEALAEATRAWLLAPGERDRAAWDHILGVPTVERLLALGLLETNGGASLWGRPPWVWMMAAQRVVPALAGERLGELVLSSPDVALRQIQADPWPTVERAIAGADGSPEAVAALEACFVVVGEKARDWFITAEHRALAVSLWEAQGRAAAVEEGLPAPRRTQRGRWWAAALALAKHLGAAAAAWPADPAGVMRGNAPGSPEFDRVLEGLELWRDAPPTQRIFLANLVAGSPEVPLRRSTAAGHLARLLDAGEDPGPALDHLHPADAGAAIAATFGLPTREGRDALALARAVAEHIWARWTRPGEERLDHETGWQGISTVAAWIAESSWRSEGAERIASWLALREETYTSLPVAGWRAALRGARVFLPHLLGRVPAAALDAALDEDPLPTEVVAECWRTRADRVADAWSRAIAAGSADRVFRLLAAAPPERRESLVSGIGTMEQELARLPAARAWALERCRRREPGWRAVWAWTGGSA